MKTTLALALISVSASAAMINKPVTYSIGKETYEGVLIYDDAVKATRPGVLLVPNWLGITPANLKQAELVAGQRYVVFVADVFGKTTRPKNQEEAGKASGALKADRALLRKRATAAMEAFQKVTGAPLEASKLAAIGFCFGGTTAIELARTGAPLKATVSIHGGLDSLKPEDAKKITGKVLALHGADDPFVPAKDVEAFENEMREAKVDWTLIKYGGAVHSFTDVDAAMAGKAQYNPVVAARAYATMHQFLSDAFQ